MPVADKLRLMDAVWDDLCRDEGDVPVPDWHCGELDERAREVATGQARFSDWDEAKRRVSGRAA